MKIEVFHDLIFFWWKENGRVLPWRQKATGTYSTVRDHAFSEYFATQLRRDPYKVVVSEIMLQQTQVDRVIPRYTEWMSRWQTVTQLALADLSQVLIAWKGLGYNRRARQVWMLAKEIDNRGGIWPESEKELIKLPGIGRYTARAVMCFAFGKQVGIVDTNVKRVFSRWFSFSDQPDWFGLADQCLPEGLSDPWNQALMDFGALICTAQNPRCDVCPLSGICQLNLWAQSQGFTTYAQWKKTVVIKKTQKTGKDYKHGKKIPFAQTDRYLRGRIIDVLRERSVVLDQLVIELSSNFPQFTKKRIRQTVWNLHADSLIKIDGRYLHL